MSPPTTRSPTAAWAPSGWPPSSPARATSCSRGSTACRPMPTATRASRRSWPRTRTSSTKEVFTGWDFTKGGHRRPGASASGNYDGVWTSGIDYTVVNAFKTVDAAGPGRRGRQPVHPAAAGRAARRRRHQPGGHRRGRDGHRPRRTGKTVERETLLTPRSGTPPQDKSTLEANSFPDREATFSSAVSVKPYTTYTNDQLFACKGPGE